VIGGGPEVAAGHRVQAKDIARKRLCRIERDDRLEMPARLRRAAGLTRLDAGREMILDGQLTTISSRMPRGACMKWLQCAG
jgi:hypothetical protein